MNSKEIENKKYLLLGDLIIDRYMCVRSNGPAQEKPELNRYVSNRIELTLGGAGNLFSCLEKLGINPEGNLVDEIKGNTLKNLSKKYSLKTRFFDNQELLFRLDKDKYNKPTVDSLLVKESKDEISDYSIIISDYTKGSVNLDVISKVLKNNFVVYLSPKPQILFDLIKLPKIITSRTRYMVCNKSELNSAFKLYIENTQPYGRSVYSDEKEVFKQFLLGIFNNFNYLIVTNSSNPTEVYFNYRYKTDVDSLNLQYSNIIEHHKVPVYKYLNNEPLDVVDPTGAGDSFFAAFIYYTQQGFNIKESISYANAAGGISVSKCGCYQPTVKEIEKLVVETIERFSK